MAKQVNVIVFTCLLFGLFSPLVFAQSTRLVDPMRPDHVVHSQPEATLKSEPSTQPPVWKLTAVLLATDRRVAVINGQSLQVGDSLDGYQLVEILSDRVQLQKNKSRVFLRRSGTGLRKDSR